MFWDKNFTSEEVIQIKVWMLETIAHELGIDIRQIGLAEKIDNCVNKSTSCGCFVKFDDEGLFVGTIVNDLEYSERIKVKDLFKKKNPTKKLTKRFWKALDNCERFADEHMENMLDCA